MSEVENTVVLISCVSNKAPYKTRAKDLYRSPLFRMNFLYARQFAPKQVLILSAKYGLVNPDEEIEPYDVTLNSMTAPERKKWASQVVSQLQQHCNLEKDHFVVLAGQVYRQYIVPHLRSYEVPLAGLPIGKQLRFLKEKTGCE